MRTLFFSLWVLSMVSSLSVIGQGRNSWWFFGDSAGIHFDSTGNMFPVTGSLYSMEASATISDEEGNLLFYTNGMLVWNRNHQLMAGDDTLCHNCRFHGYTINTYTNGVLILPHTTNPSIYYIFYLDSSRHLYHAIVDMGQDNGNGEVTRQGYLGGISIHESIAATRHANGTDWWIHVYELATYEHLFFLMTENGPVFSHSQSIGVGGAIYQGIGGESKFSSNGSKFARASATVLELYEFNRCTGYLFNFYDLSAAASTGTGAYGVEFSLSGKYLYFTTYKHLVRFNTLVPNIWGSLRILLENRFYSYNSSINCQDTVLRFLGLMIEPYQGKILFTQYKYNFPFSLPCVYQCTSHLTIIRDADAVNPVIDTCSFPLFGRWTPGGLPTNPNYYLGPFPVYEADAGPDVTICIGDSAQLGVASSAPGVSYFWQAADGSFQSSEPRPEVSPAVTTVFYLHIQDADTGYTCNSRWDTVTVYVIQNIEPVIMDTTVVFGALWNGRPLFKDTTIHSYFTDSSGCSQAIIWNVQVLPNSIFLLNNERLLVFPNPVRGVLYVKHNNQNAAFRLYNKLGQVVIEQQNLPPGTAAISLRGLAEGVYFWEYALVGSGERVFGKTVKVSDE